TLLVEWNQTESEFPKHLTLHRCFEQQVERTPDATALIFQHEELTYQELNHRANQLAYAIRENYQHKYGCPLEPDTPVMLYLERSLEMVVAILAVLKAGAAYVPVAPEFPEARTLFMMEDTQTPIVLTQQTLTPRLDEWVSTLNTPPSVLAIDDATVFASYPTRNLQAHSSSSDLAYILYTSGTTGQPKGVMLQHDGVVNRIHWMQKQYPLTETDRVLQKTPYVFDVSVWELLWANWVGATIVIAEPDSHKDPQQLCQTIVQHQVTTLHFVPSMLQVFGQYLSEQSLSLPKSIRWVFASGEALSATHCDLFKQVRHPQAQLHNLYGPTEASIDVTYYDCQKLSGTNVPIGQPIDNTKLYVLSELGKPVPVGAPGELYLGGIGVARGYLNREELTQERFIPNPFDTDGQAPRLYKTGDLVRWLPDGNLEYLGRNDFQVKIRGLRIELGEIEQRLTVFEDVKHAVITVNEIQGEPALFAYIVTHSRNELDEKVVASTLSQHLPSYMLPVSYTYLNTLPVTINGKLDRAALPAPNAHSTRDYVAPSSPLECTLCEIWQEVLGLERVSVEDNFFRLG
ncbi:non-ribosomal peptide synthetase, partial [Vibrio splendidus]|uniref:non-ribosomal peptide synthetase n=1 Tax=Vibrio splendidus TaxID=29497 RepID=UPI0018E4257C